MRGNIVEGATLTKLGKENGVYPHTSWPPPFTRHKTTVR